MIGMHLPPVLRSLHEATGVSIWIATFALAYLARSGAELGGRARGRAAFARRLVVGPAAATTTPPLCHLATMLARRRESEQVAATEEASRASRATS